MTICAVIDNHTNELINTIVAEPTDPPPANCRLIELTEGHYWSAPANQLIPETSYWNGNAVVAVPDGYHWNGVELVQD
jgi:hypothetical protein